MRLLRLLVPALLALMLSPLPSAAADRAIIVLDGSGSMWAQIDGVARITIARQTLRDVLNELPEDFDLGFMTYGHRTKGDCDDIELMVEPAPGTAEAILAAADSINPKGKTPISAAVSMAAENLNFTEDKATVILITDGLETCEADPCALASELESQGIDFTTHVVGFGLSDEEGQEVKCLAENTGGEYIQASDASELTEALTRTVAEVVETEPVAEPEPEPVPGPLALDHNLDPDAVLVEGGASLAGTGDVMWQLYAVNADGTKGENLSTDYGADWKTTLEPGNYILVATIGYASSEQLVTIAAGELAEPYFVLNAGLLLIHPRASEGAEVDAAAAVFTEFPNGLSTTSYGDTRLYVPAGDTRVTVEIGLGKLVETIPVAAGETVEKNIVVGVGHATINAFYVEGLKVEGPGLAVNIVGANKDMEGNRKDFGTAYGPDTGFDLPPGDYVAILSIDPMSMEVPFTIKAGEATEVNGMLNAGVLAITAPGASAIDVYSAEKDINGDRKKWSYAYGETREVTMPAGQYVITATLSDGSTKESKDAVTVTAGERKELSIE